MKTNLLLYLLTSLALCYSAFANAQINKCNTMYYLEQKIAKDPTLQAKMEQSEINTQKWISEHEHFNKTQQIITIPVVVHVLYHNQTENISNAQIQSQIDVLNDDFRSLNADTLNPNHPFYVYTADTRIEFCLAAEDPNGNPTNGIVRKYTDSTTFAETDSPKFSSTGGDDNWNPTKYLNIWVCNLNGLGGVLGYATFPASLSSFPDDDGVVIRYEAFGTIGTAGSGGFSGNNLGRTATHEVGHWLNLRHIWGDDNCGDDLVNDTEVALESNYFCPIFPHNANSTCGSGSNGEMYMNYMDYVDDNCMNMFTVGQANRMRAALNGERNGLLTSVGCNNPEGIKDLSFSKSIEVYPNPSNGLFTIYIVNHQFEINEISIHNVFGQLIKKIDNVKSLPCKIDLKDYSNGIYFFKINTQNKIITKKIIITE